MGAPEGDAGKKASGEGWFLTVTLVEGDSIGGANLRDLADPYVVFTCNGKTRTSSVKLQSIKPKWNGELPHLSRGASAAELLASGSPLFDTFEDVLLVMEVVELFEYQGLVCHSEHCPWVPDSDLLCRDTDLRRVRGRAVDDGSRAV